MSGDDSPARPVVSRVFRTTEVQLKCYDAGGPTDGKDPPWDLAIIRRSGFLAPKPAAVATASDRAAERARGPSRRRLGVTRSAGLPGLVATQAVVANAAASQPVDADPLAASGSAGASRRSGAATTSADTQARPDGPACAARASAPSPARRPAVMRRPTTDPQVQQARAAQVPAGAQPPDIDLPPIEGAPEVQVPKLPLNPEDLPPNIEPLPGPDGSVSVPELPRTGPVEGEDGDRRASRPRASRRADHAGSFRTTSLFARSGRQLEIVKLANHARRREDLHLPRRHQHRHPHRQVRHDRHRGRRGRDLARARPQEGRTDPGPNGETWVDDSRQPMEVYLEGNVVLRQDEQQFAGKGDQRTVRAPRLYYDFLTERLAGAQCRNRLVRPVAPGADQDQVATHRAVSPADSVAQRDIRPRR